MENNPPRNIQPSLERAAGDPGAAAGSDLTQRHRREFQPPLPQPQLFAGHMQPPAPGGMGMPAHPTVAWGQHHGLQHQPAIVPQTPATIAATADGFLAAPPYHTPVPFATTILQQVGTGNAPATAVQNINTAGGHSSAMGRRE